MTQSDTESTGSFSPPGSQTLGTGLSIPIPDDGDYHLIQVKKTKKGKIRVWVDNKRVQPTVAPAEVGTVEIMFKRTATLTGNHDQEG